MRSRDKEEAPDALLANLPGHQAWVDAEKKGVPCCALGCNIGFSSRRICLSVWSESLTDQQISKAVDENEPKTYEQHLIDTLRKDQAWQLEQRKVLEDKVTKLQADNERLLVLAKASAEFLRNRNDGGPRDTAVPYMRWARAIRDVTDLLE